MANILCVDDEPESLESRQKMLETDGHRVWNALSAAEGLRIFRAENIDLVILDYYLTDTQGLILAADIKRLNPSVPIIVLSGFAQLPGEGIGLAIRWILKGTGPAKLLQVVRELTAKPKPNP